MRILVTGGCGFIGHHIVEAIIKNTGWDIVVLDRLNYASNGFDRLREISVFDDKRIRIFTHDFTRPLSDGIASEIGKIDYILHVGAETSVDKSIEDPATFVRSNVLGTMEMLEFARTQDNLRLFLYFSTDEVFGPAPSGTAYAEWDRYDSTNPYSASKAGGEELCLAWANTYKLPVIITHTMNVFGERQHGEKFIPSTIRKVLDGEKVIIHADKTKTVPGSRFYIHARNVADAVMFLIDGDIPKRDKYNIVGEKEVNNLELAQYIAAVLGKELKYELVSWHASRPGHDLRYALNGKKMKELGWKIPVNFEQALTKTIRWFIKNEKWLYGK